MTTDRAARNGAPGGAISDDAGPVCSPPRFDAVTTAEIAAAADVAVGTVFNHFATKEDLFFDRADALVDDLVTAVTGRPGGASVADAFRRWHTREIDFLLDPRASAHTLRFFRTIVASPACRRPSTVSTSDWRPP